MEDINLYKDTVKLLAVCAEEKGIRPEYGCVIQKNGLLYTYNDKIYAMMPNNDTKEYAVSGKALSKFLSTKNLDGFTVVSNQSETTFQLGNKKMVLASMQVDSETLMKDVYGEIEQAEVVEVDATIQKDFIKILKQVYVPCATNFAYAGVFMFDGGFTSTDGFQYSIYTAKTPIKQMVHIPSHSLDYLLKVKEPIQKIGYHSGTRNVYFFGESGIVYVCLTSSLQAEAIEAQQGAMTLVSGFAKNSYFTITEEAADAIDKASIAHSAFSSKLGFELKGNAGRVYSNTETADFSADFGWDEATEIIFDVAVDYDVFTKYARVGTRVYVVDVDERMRGLYLINDSHSVFVPQMI